jgi:signal transduction histidine kinase
MPVPEVDGAASLRVADHMSSQVRSVPATATLHEAARVLAEHEISCVVVLEADTPVGILSERDLVRHVVGDPQGWGGRPVRDAMTRPLHLASPDESIARAIGDLSRHHIRRLPVVNAGGELVGIVTQTDLLRAAQQRLQEYTADLERLVAERTADLREIERRRDDLVDLTVHDIKNSLCVLDAALGLDGRAIATASVAPLLRRAVRRIRLLVYALLDINRLENGSMPLRVREVPWATLCDPLLAEAGVLARTKSIVVEASGERRTIVRCDPELVERVLLNLLDNAIGAAPEGSTVTVHADRLADGSFAVRIGNRGPVIAPDALATLFEKYRQGDAAPVRRFGGWGLGLTFCRLAAELHGGSIRAVSPWVAGEGAAFELVVPAEPAP